MFGKPQSDPTQEWFLSHCHVHKYPAKSTLIHAGEKAETLYYIVKGSVAVLIKDEEGKAPKQRIPTEFNHWLYGPCNNESDTEGIGYLIKHKYYEQSACIRKYYDKSKDSYYDTGDPNFRWPIIIKGCSNPDRTFYGVIIEKCNDDEVRIKSGYESCKTNEEINNFIKKNSVIL